MDLECAAITRVILPAVRASVAEEMKHKYKYNQQQIADILGIAQVAVSKYLNGRYSSSVKKIKEHIMAKGLDKEIVNSVLSANEARVNRSIDKLCEELYSDNLVY